MERIAVQKGYYDRITDGITEDKRIDEKLVNSDFGNKITH